MWASRPHRGPLSFAGGAWPPADVGLTTPRLQLRLPRSASASRWATRTTAWRSPPATESARWRAASGCRHRRPSGEAGRPSRESATASSRSVEERTSQATRRYRWADIHTHDVLRRRARSLHDVGSDRAAHRGAWHSLGLRRRPIEPPTGRNSAAGAAIGPTTQTRSIATQVLQRRLSPVSPVVGESPRGVQAARCRSERSASGNAISNPSFRRPLTRARNFSRLTSAYAEGSSASSAIRTAWYFAYQAPAARRASISAAVSPSSRSSLFTPGTLSPGPDARIAVRTFFTVVPGF